MIRRPPRSTLFPYPPLSRSRRVLLGEGRHHLDPLFPAEFLEEIRQVRRMDVLQFLAGDAEFEGRQSASQHRHEVPRNQDRKSTRLNSSHLVISYAVFCLKKK